MIKRIHKALHRAKEEVGTQKNLEAKTGISQSSIAAFLNGARKIENMTVGTLTKLFPEMEIYFFRKDLKNKLSPCELKDAVLIKLFQKLMRMSPEDLNDLNDYVNRKYPDADKKQGK